MIAIFFFVFIACTDIANCLNSGKEVLMKYGFVSNNLYFDLTVLLLFSVVANILGYIGILRRMKKQPAY